MRRNQRRQTLWAGRSGYEVPTGRFAVWRLYRKRAGLSENTTIYVSASAMEEDFDGEAVRQFLTASGLRPDGVVICEPTGLKIATGHRGRALIEVTVNGKGCHASNPANGVNPVYLMEEIIHKVREQAAVLDAREARRARWPLTNISCSTASNNSVPPDRLHYTGPATGSGRIGISYL